MCGIATTSLRKFTFEFGRVVYKTLLTKSKKALLYAIAAEGKAKGITSAAFIRRHKLSTASSVQAATKKLLSSDIITNENKEYSVSDKLIC